MSELELSGKFIAFNGAICAGKTTQAKLLADFSGAELLLGNESEQPEINSGEIFTQGSSLEVENWFVAHHLGRLTTVNAAIQRGLVADMSLQHDLVWARALLIGRKLDEFERTFHPIAARQLKPDVSFLFLLPPGVLLRRIQARIKNDRNRRFESNTKIEFISKIQDVFIDNQNDLAKSTHVIDLRKREGLSPKSIHKIILSELENL